MIGRLTGDMLLRISHVVPLVRIIIAPRPPLPPTATAVTGLVGLWGRARSAFRLFGGAGSADVAVVAGSYDGWLGAFGNRVLNGFLVTTREWAMSDPVWYDVFFSFLSMSGSPFMAVIDHAPPLRVAPPFAAALLHSVGTSRGAISCLCLALSRLTPRVVRWWFFQPRLQTRCQWFPRPGLVWCSCLCTSIPKG